MGGELALGRGVKTVDKSTHSHSTTGLGPPTGRTGRTTIDHHGMAWHGLAGTTTVSWLFDWPTKLTVCLSVHVFPSLVLVSFDDRGGWSKEVWRRWCLTIFLLPRCRYGDIINSKVRRHELIIEHMSMGTSICTLFSPSLPPLSSNFATDLDVVSSRSL